MIPQTLITFDEQGKVFLNGQEIPNFADFQQMATELKHNEFFKLLVADAKCRAYLDGFLNTKAWDVTLGLKGWHGCAANMEEILEKVIQSRG